VYESAVKLLVVRKFALWARVQVVVWMSPTWVMFFCYYCLQL